MTAGSPARLASHPAAAAAAAARSSRASSRMAGALFSTREAYATTLRGLRRTASAVSATNSGPMSTGPPKRAIPADARLHLVAKRPTNVSLGWLDRGSATIRGTRRRLRGSRRRRGEGGSDGALAEAASGEGEDADGDSEVADDRRDDRAGGQRRGASRVAQDHGACQEIPVSLPPQPAMDDPVQDGLDEVRRGAVIRHREDEHAQHDRSELDLLGDGVGRRAQDA